ncbi:MAG: DUF2461 domain-containing protein [Bacteroidaceae bacterium]|nr:DUF2461 domain-containing protein [Bacteroidaceae bacterium]
MPTTTSQRRKVFAFLRQIKRHNDRVWFNANRPLYQEARDVFLDMSQELIDRIATFDPEIGGIAPKSTVYRINRDTRFSADKSPYKTHLGSFITPHGPKSAYLGYYLHVEPGASLVACGGYWLTPEMLAAVRNSIVAETDRFRAIVEAPAFREAFGTELGVDCLKTLPKGFPKDYPHPEYLRPRAYTVWHNLSDDELLDASWADRAADLCRLGKPFMDFINDTVADYL